MRRSVGKEILDRPSCRWEYNIKIDLREADCVVMNWTNLAEDGD